MFKKWETVKWCLGKLKVKFKVRLLFLLQSLKIDNSWTMIEYLDMFLLQHQWFIQILHVNMN